MISFTLQLFNRAIFDKAELFRRNSEKEHLPRCWGCSNISFNAVEKCFGELYVSLKFIFDLSPEKEMQPDDSKIVRVTPVFKGGDRSDTNISVSMLFPSLSQIPSSKKNV